MENEPQSSPITIRHAEPDDYQAVHKIFTGPKAIAGTMQVPFPSLERWRQRLADRREGSYFLVACAGEDVIGQLGLHTFPDRPRRRHVGQLGMAVRDDWQGKGVGSALLEAAVDLSDNWLQLTRLELQVYTDNQPALHLYKKFGFTIEGTLKGFAFREGEFINAHMMARLRPDFAKGSP